MKWLREMFERRKSDRRRCRRFSGPLDLRLITASRHALPAELEDISASGLRFRVRAPMTEKHVPVAVYVRSGSWQETIPIEVVRSEERSRTGPVLAARFLSLVPDAVDMVVAGSRNDFASITPTPDRRSMPRNNYLAAARHAAYC